MIALVDCNSFFCSVEKVFHPGLRGKPVCVLSNNDGCIVALTPEAKRLGLRRGDPIFKVKSIVEANHVTVFSTNMQLYAAMSRRVTNILRKSVAKVENYSIDESFCYLDGYERLYSLEEFMRDIVERIQLWTDIPVSVGVAPTKTLAKIGSKFAKQYKGYRGVCVIDDEQKRRRALELFELADVWGIGRQTLQQLNYYGIHTPLDFADRKEGWVKAHFHKPAVQTWLELNGVPCIDTSEVVRNQNICTSRSFGQMVGDLPSLKASVATFASSCANKLRGQRSVAGAVTVFLSSNRFRDDLQQYANAATYYFITPTADTLEITQGALRVLEQIYCKGILYKKSGVVVSEISADTSVQYDLFDGIRNRGERQQLMTAIDELNHRYGPKTVQLVVEGEKEQRWKVKCEHRSPNYLSKFDELMMVKI